ncbi:MAG: glycosyltransferase family 39 protein [Dehalococcoidia bacterium]
MTRAALAAIVLWQLAIGSLYALFTPPWQAPDEPAHFNYARHLAATGTLPVLQLGDYDATYLELLKASRFALALPIDSVRYEGHQPPAAYLLAAPLVALAGPNALTAVRLLSVALGGVLVVVIFAIVRTILPNRPDLVLLAAALPAVIPQHLAIFASASNDALASVGVALALLLTVRLVAQRYREGRPPTARQLLLLGLVLALCILTKVTAYVVLPVALVGLLWAGVGWRGVALAFAPPAVAGLLWAGRNVALYGPLDPLGLARHDLVVAGQPLTGAIGLGTLRTFAAVGFQSFWGQFGWMGVLMDGWVYGLLWAGTILALLGLLAFFVDLRRGLVPIDDAGRRLLSLLGLLFALIIAGFLWYNLRYLQPQGRYLFAAIPAIAFAIAAGLRWVFSERWGWLPLAYVYGGLAALDLFALWRYIVPQLTP